MKKYKLIKEFPGSPKLGTINTNDQLSWKGEDYPEFWQEVVEKDYKILSYISTSGAIWTLHCGIMEMWGNDTDSKLISYDKLISQPIYNIHSIKRLSDGEI